MYNGKADDKEINSLSLLFPAIFCTGMFIMNFGQFFISWNTSHLDFYFGKPSGLASLIKGKMMILLFSNLNFLKLSSACLVCLSKIVSIFMIFLNS